MPRIRPELIRGLAVLGIFFVVIVSTDLFLPYTVNPEGYTVVGIRRLNENPLPLEGLAISTTATIDSVVFDGNHYLAEVSENATLVFSSSIAPPEVGQRILLRGISWLYTNGSIRVQEFYALDYSSSLIRSIPGIILFVVMFFMVFKIDFRQLAFVSKEEVRDDA